MMKHPEEEVIPLLDDAPVLGQERWLPGDL